MNCKMTGIDAVERKLALQLQAEWCRLTPLAVSCSYPVFRAELSDGRRAFLKLGDKRSAKSVAQRLSELAECPLVPRILVGPSADFADGRALCLEWKDCRKIEVGDLTDAEADSLVDGAVRFSQALQHVTGVNPRVEEDDPDRQYGLVRDFARRHPLAARLLHGLLAIPPSKRSYGARQLKVIHGDFHALNFGFAEGRLSAVFDFDSLERGLPCEDLAYALCEDMRRGGRGACRRARLLDLFARFRARAPWPTADWLIAVNHARLRIAARRLEKHPHNPLVALDVLRRDRLLRPLVAACLQEMV